jgi:hypothetical protein
MKNKIQIFIALLLICNTALLLAQSDYEEWLKKDQQQFDEYKTEQDRLFMEFLENDWKEFQVFQGLKADDTPKPAEIPQAEPQPLQQTEIERNDTIKELDVPEVHKSFKSPEKKLKAKPDVKPWEQKEQVETPQIQTKKEVQKTDVLSISVDFYEAPVSIPDESSLRISLKGKPDNESIAEYWKSMSNAKFEGALQSAETYKKSLALNDWGYCSLVYSIGEKINSGDGTDALLLTWFMLNKSGYDAKIGYSDNNVYLLLPSKDDIFGAPYFAIDKKRFYVMSLDGKELQLGSMYTYEGDYPDANKVISLNLNTLPVLWGNVPKQVTFSYNGTDYTINYTYNKNIVKFLNTYPHTSYPIYFNTPLMDQSYASLVAQLKPILTGKSKSEALNILLRFVQTAFEYKTDQQQFGKEKCLFAEETLFYPYCDCEDRSVIFAYLVKKLLGLEVIGLDYPGHIATAVKIDNVPGDYVTVNGKKYLICDPTYINANIGMSMPRYKNVKPEIVQISQK